MGYPRAPLLLLLVHLCLVLPGAAGLSFSYDFSIPDPGGINRKILRTVPDYGNSENRCNGVICLNASTEKNSSARVYYKQPVRLWDGLTGRRASFRTSFSFALHGGGGRNTTQGPGTAFFIGPFPSSLPPNSGGGLLGLGSNPTSPRLISQFATPTLAVEFDTQWDPDWDPSDVAGDHVGIDLDMIVSDSYSRDLARGDLSAGTVTADIAYDAGSNVLEVTVRLANGSTTSVRALVNLRKQRLPQDAAIGFSTGTGAADTNYDPVLISWSFSSTDPSIPLWVIILSSVASALLAASLVGALIFFIMRKRLAALMKIELPVAKEFSYKELSASTNNFSEDRKLGAGSFGKVYRGDLLDPRMPPVAAKVLTGKMDSQMRKDFVTEVTTLCQLSHRNLVKLVGWCNGGGNGKPLLLVYELVPNGSLDEHLHGQAGRPLTWPERYQVAVHVGTAVEYLHSGSNEPIIHRDIKPANVMLDDAFHAKLGDFGREATATASDVYSFGVVLLEIATGRRSQASLDPEKGFPNSLVSTVRESYHKGSIVEVADPRLNGDFDESQMTRVLTVGLLCVQLDRKLRPDIREAINMLSNPSHPVPQLGT
ncbi:hypothetical protein HU200_059897 [Digitaria exilis]|uniref:Protein kinase domain-containing protein n=1 Tax=Digitaria exilis TaxID=1010633 RepID=A0A835ABT4_9POAL|nr:hypothetical protein HU200_059897 [Digitaria exilis]